MTDDELKPEPAAPKKAAAKPAKAPTTADEAVAKPAAPKKAAAKPAKAPATADGAVAKPAAPKKATAEPAPEAPVEGAAAKPAPQAPVESAAAKPAPEAPAAATDAAAAKPAAPKKAPPPPDPRAEAAKAFAETVKAAIVAKLGAEAVEEVGAAHFTPMLRIRNEDWLSAVETLRTHEDWQLNYIECMAGTDYSDYIEIVIYVQSTSLGHFICMKTRTPRDQAEVPSLVSSHPGVNWEEREIYDLLGVTFTNHPDLRRIMMWEEFKGHPLRKDYSEWE